ncbi:MAG: DUF4272 domain-containing protein [Treponema sp.]|nr:DUF4272 domain-containing protein [Candidatus Treponema merdequi]
MKNNSDKDLTKEAQERREVSKQFLEKNGISFNSNLKLLTEEKLKKDITSQCKRAIACLMTIQLACSLYEGDRDPDNLEIISKYLDMLDSTKALLDEEKNIFKGKYTSDLLNQITLTYDAYWSILWALGIVTDAEMKVLDKTCDVTKAIQTVRECISFDEFSGKCKPRSEKEIYDMLDLLVCCQSACKEAGDGKIAFLNSDVVTERRRGLEWIVSKEKNWFKLSLSI